MAVRTIPAGEALRIVTSGDWDDKLLEVIDGQIGSLTPGENTAPESGEVLAPGKAVTLEPKDGVEEWLHAIGEDLKIQLTDQGAASSGRKVRRISQQSSDLLVARKLARAVNYAPGADTDIFDPAVPIPAAGTMKLKIVLAGASIVNVQETIDLDSGTTTISYDLNDGASLSANEGYSFTVPVRPDAEYNFQVETAVEVDLLQVDYTPEVVV